MFSEESIRRARKRVYGAESVLEEILSISSQQSVFGKWTLQGQLPNGGFKAISNSSPYSIFFILSRTEIDPDAQLDEEVASLVNMIVHYQLSLIHKSAHFYALLEVPFHLKTKDISRRLMWITDFKQLTPLPVFLRQRSSQAAWCWSFLFQVLIDVAETLQILHEDLCISCGDLDISCIYLIQKHEQRESHGQVEAWLQDFHQVHRIKGESSTSSKVRNDIVQFGVVLSQVRELLAEEVSSERTGDVEHYFQPDKLLGYPEALCALQEICLEDEMVKPTMRFCAKLLQESSDGYQTRIFDTSFRMDPPLLQTHPPPPRTNNRRSNLDSPPFYTPPPPPLPPPPTLSLIPAAPPFTTFAALECKLDAILTRLDTIVSKKELPIKDEPLSIRHRALFYNLDVFKRKLESVTSCSSPSTLTPLTDGDRTRISVSIPQYLPKDFKPRSTGALLTSLKKFTNTLEKVGGDINSTSSVNDDATEKSALKLDTSSILEESNSYRWLSLSTRSQLSLRR